MKQKFLLMLALWLSIVSSLLAQTATPPTTGNGSEANPYQIATLENLYWLSQSSSVWSMNFEQTDNIDLSPVANWPGIGNSSVPFSGVYDGQKQTITNLTINSSDSHKGLFGVIGESGYVTNLRISNATVVTTNDYAGIFAGVNQGTLQKCHVQSGSVSGVNYIGGLCGANEGSIEQSSNASLVTASGNSAGGITGIVPENGGQIYATIKNCFNYNSVTATGNSAGGIIGTSLGCQMQFCYSREGTISAASQAGGIAGFCSVNNAFSECFTVKSPAIGEGAVGSLNNVAVKSYTTIGEPATFSNWDMYGESLNGTEDIWVFSNGSNSSPVFTDQLLNSRVPNLEFTSSKSGSVSLYLGCNHTNGVFIDWGNGMLVGASTNVGRSYSQYPLENEGKTIKVYTEGITRINLYDQKITSIDISKSPDLEYLNIYNNQLTSLDLSNNSKIIDISCYNNLITWLDVSNCPNLTRLYCNSNLIESLDIQNCANLRTLSCQNNRIETLLFGENPLLSDVSCHSNKLKFSTLPAKLSGSTSNTYWPQSQVEVQCVNGEVDLSDEFLVTAGSNTDFTVFRCYDSNNNQLQLGIDYFVDSGVIRFLKVPETEVYITMINQLFNKLTLQTNNFVVDKAGTMPEPSIEFTSNKNGSLYFALSNPPRELLYIDWGSGELTPYYYSTATSVIINTSSYAAGQTIKLYAPNVTGFEASDELLTSLDITRATNLQTLNCYNNNLEVLDLSNNSTLTTIDCSRNELTSLDVSASNVLTSIKCPENLISSLVIGDNPSLTELVCYGNNLNLSTLPVPKSTWTNFKYNIQSNFDIVPNSEGAIDLSAHINLLDENGQPKPTSFSWHTTGGSVLTNGSDYFEENGVFYFTKKPATQVYCELTNYDLFPDWTFKSVNIEIEKTFEDEPVILLASDTEYFILKLTATESTPIGIDGGDGNIVTLWAGTTEQQFSTVNYVPGTIVKIYGKKINGINLENQNLQTTYLEISDKLDMRDIRCAGNKFSFASLPVKKASYTNYSYAPQQLMNVKAINNQVDLSAEWLVVDENGTSHYTTYTWYSSLDNLVLLEGEDYTVSDGVFSFINIKYPVAYCVMTNTAFPGLELSTSEVMIDNALISLSANNDYFDFSLATPEVGQKVYIDWGNGTVLSYFSDDTKQIQINSNFTYYNAGDIVNIYGTNIRHFWSINSAYISYLDVSNCKSLELLRIPYCAITSLDVSQNSELEILDCSNSNLSEIDVSQNAKLQTLECENNKLTFETLPKVNLNYYSYSPQSNFDAPYANGIVNLSDQFLVSNANGETYPTVSSWFTEGGEELISGVDYIASNGVFYFQQIPASRVYCVLTNEAFPDLTLKSNPITIDAVGGMPGHFITFTSNNSGNIIFSAAGTYNSRLYVDWGDGLVHAVNLDANITEIASSSYVAGQTVKLYGDWFSYFDISGQAISSVDVSQNAFLSQFNCSNNEISALNVENNPALSELYCNNNSLSALNLSQNTRLEKLNTSNNALGSLNLLPNTALIELACSNNQLNSLDVSANTALTKLVCAENNLDGLNLSGNTGITNLDCHSNLLGSLNISTLASLETLNCSNNQLNNIDLSNSSKYTNLNVSNNNLQSIDISGVTYGSTVDVSSNYFHLTSLPDLLIRYSLTYAPQKEYSADCTNGVVDLGSQLISGWNNRYTVYKWYQSNGTPLVLGTDYLSSDGIFYFLNNAGGQVYCEMTNTAYPDLTLKTVLITIDEVASLPEPLFSFTSEASADLRIHAKNNRHSNLYIDWGNGELAVCHINTVYSAFNTSSYVSGATVKVYGDQPSGLIISNQQVNTFEAGGLSKLNEMYLNENNLSNIDLSSFESLKYFYISNNKLVTLDLSQNTSLLEWACSDNLLESIMLCPDASYFNISLTNNKLNQLDLSAYSGIYGLYVSNNKFTLQNLPQPNAGFNTFEYAPQGNIEVACTNGVVDLSSQLTALDEDSNPVKTVYTWYDADNNLLTPGVDYVESDGLFMFLKVPATTVYCKLANSVYPDFADDNALRTVDITIDKAIDPAFTFESGLTGNLAFTIEASVVGTMSVDWGNGIFTPFHQTTSATTLTTAEYTANNTVKVYTLGVTGLNISSQELTSLDVSNLGSLVSLNCSQNKLVILDINSNLLLSELNCSDNSLLFSTLPQSSTLQSYSYAPQAKYQATCINGVVDLSSQLSASDASGQAHATSYSWYVDGGDQLLAAYDYIEENGVFTFVKNLGASVYCIMNNDAFPDLALQTENITIDAVLEPSTTFVSIKNGTISFSCSASASYDIYVDKGDGMLSKFNVNNTTDIVLNGYSAGNNVKIYSENIIELSMSNMGLIALDVSQQTNLESLECEDNYLKFNSLPIPQSSYNIYTFAPQGKMDVTCLGGIVDLSSQLNVVDENGQTNRTEYKWFLLDGTPVDQSGYYNEYDGVFHFLNIPASQVYCTMTNSAFAGLSLQTVDLTIDEYNLIRVNLEAASTEISENGGLAIITANLSSASENDIEVTLGISTLSTASSSDYALSATSIHIPAGSTSGSVTLSAIDNSTPHEDLSVVVTIESCVNAISNFNQQVSVLIKDDELMPLQIETPTLDVSKVYDGNADATVIAGVLSNIRSGESVSVSATATYNDANAATDKTITVAYSISGSDAGRYSAPENYVMNSAEITKAPLTVTAHSQSKVYGQSNPALTIEYDGFVNGDDANDLDEQPVAVTDIDEYSDADTYYNEIYFSGGSDNNYDLSFVSGDFEITQATLTVTAHNQSKVYGESNPILTFEYSGFVNGDDATDLDAEPDVVTDIYEYSNAGSYPSAITFTGGLDNNYEFDFVDGDFEITKATLSVVAHEQEKVYGESNPALTFHYEGWVNGEESIDVAPSISTTIDATSDADYYTGAITLSGGSDNNYTFVFVPGDFEITKAPLTVTAHSQSKVYGQSNPALTIEYDGFVNGDDANDLDEQPVAVTDIDEYSDAYTYYNEIYFSGGSDNNYDLSFVSGDFEITQATLTVTAHNQSKVYGDFNPALTFEYSGFVNGDDATDLEEQPAVVTNIDTDSNAGSYPNAITFWGGWDNNYEMDFVDGDFEITKATLTVYADDQTKVYGESNPVLTLDYIGFVNLDNADDLDLKPIASTLINEFSNVGSFPNSIILSGGEDNNYTFDFVNGDFEVTKATLTVIADNKTKVYGESNPELTISYDGFINGDDTLDLTTLPSINLDGDGVNVGEYDILVAGAQADNYEIEYTNGKLNVETALLTVRADNKSINFNQPIPELTLTYSGFVSGEDVTNLTAVPTASTVAVQGSPEGEYDIEVTGGVADNYSFNYVKGMLTISPKQVPVLSWSAPADITYGTPLGFAQLNAVAIVGTDTIDGSFVYTPDLGTVLHTGISQALHVAFTPNNDALYESVSGDNTINVYKAPLTVFAVNDTIVYGEPIPVLNVLYSGFVNGDDAGVLFGEPVASLAAGDGINAGDYTISLSVTSSDDYEITYQTGVFVVEKATLTVTAHNQTKVYGESNPVLTFEYDGFVNNDGINVLDEEPVAVTTIDELSNADYYTAAITFTGGDDNNYKFDFVPGDFEITKATLTVTAHKQTKVYGQSNPVLTFEYDGFVNYDGIADLDEEPTISTTINELSNAGLYPDSITLTGGSDNNYLFSFVAGDFDITKVTLTVTAHNQTKVYGQSNPELTFEYDGFVNNEGISDLDEEPTISTTINALSNAGLYTDSIILSGGVADNYAFNLVPGDFKITKAHLTVKADKKTKTYGNPNPELTYSYSGWVNGVEPIDIEPQISTTLTDSSAVGFYFDAIKLKGGLDNNYELQLQPGDFKINKAILYLTATNASKVYGHPNPDLHISYNGFVNNDKIDSIDVLPLISTWVNESTDAGIYPEAISVMGGSDNNYKLKYLPGDFEVQKAPLTVRAHNQSRMYGHPNPELTIWYEGFVLDQDPGVLDVLPFAQTEAVINSEAGNYSIEVSGGSDNNYRFEYINGVLSIDSKTLPVVTWDIPAPIVYGTALDTMQQNAKANIAGTFSYSPAEGTVLNSGLAQQLSVVFTPADTATYQTVEQRVSIDVTPAQLTIRADSYRLASGSELPGLGCRVEGFVNGETIEELDVMPQVSTTATSTSQPGVYPITVSGAQAQNYEFVYVEGTLEIVEKQMPEIVWETPSAIVYGTALNSSQLNAVANVAGTYVYSPSEGSILEAGQAQELSLLFIPDDTVSYARVEKTVNIDVLPAVLSVQANDASVVYGQELPAFGYSISGFVNGETASDLLALPEAVAEQNNRPDAGTYTIVARGGSSNNYVFEYSNGTLSVSKAPVMVTARDTKMKRGEALPEFSLDYEGLVYGQSSTDLEQQAVVSTTATADSPVGEYELVPGGAADSNYQFEYVSGTLTIEAGTSFAELALRNAKVYPNPFTDELSIAFDQAIEAVYTISTVSGQQLIEGQIEGSGQKLNLSALRKGVYLLHVNSNDCVKTFRLVKH